MSSALLTCLQWTQGAMGLSPGSPCAQGNEASGSEGQYAV